MAELPMVESDSVQKGTETILLIDDEESVLVGIEFMLVKLGYTVHSSDDGQKAIEIFKRRWQEIDLVILDLVMPQMLGTEVFEKLREIDPECRVLMASGYSSEEDAQALLDKGCLGYLQKPFNIDRLSTRIREILDR